MACHPRLPRGLLRKVSNVDAFKGTSIKHSKWEPSEGTSGQASDRHAPAPRTRIRLMAKAAMHQPWKPHAPPSLSTPRLIRRHGAEGWCQYEAGTTGELNPLPSVSQRVLEGRLQARRAVQDTHRWAARCPDTETSPQGAPRRRCGNACLWARGILAGPLPAGWLHPEGEPWPRRIAPCGTHSWRGSTRNQIPGDLFRGPAFNPFGLLLLPFRSCLWASELSMLLSH